MHPLAFLLLRRCLGCFPPSPCLGPASPSPAAAAWPLLPALRPTAGPYLEPRETSEPSSIGCKGCHSVAEAPIGRAGGGAELTIKGGARGCGRPEGACGRRLDNREPGCSGGSEPGGSGGPAPISSPHPQSCRARNSRRRRRATPRCTCRPLRLSVRRDERAQHPNVPSSQPGPQPRGEGGSWQHQEGRGGGGGGGGGHRPVSARDGESCPGHSGQVPAIPEEEKGPQLLNASLALPSPHSTALTSMYLCLPVPLSQGGEYLALGLYEVHKIIYLVWPRPQG